MRRVGLVMLAIVPAALAVVAERAAGPSPAWRATARAAAATTVDDHLSTGPDIVGGLARHFQEWEALVPEALERSLRVFGERCPSLRRLAVMDGEGRVLAAFDAGARLGAERRLLGAVDPAAGRLAAMRRRPVVWRAAVVEAGTVERLELGAPILGADGAVRGYVAADLELRSLCERLASLEAPHGLILGLYDAEGRVVCPATRIPPTGGERVQTSSGMTLVLRVPLWRRVLVPSGALALALLLGALASLLGRRPRAG